MNWSIDKDRKHVHRFLSQLDVEIVDNIFRSDIVFSVWHTSLLSAKHYYLVSFLKRIKRIKIIVIITNDTFHDRLERMKSLVDIFIAPNRRIFRLLREDGLDAQLIPFFVDTGTFHPLKLSRRDICSKLGLDYERIGDKTLIGSFQRDSLGKDLSQPRWQKDPDLLIRIMKELPRDGFCLLLAGPRRHYIINKCKEHDIDFVFIGDYSHIEKGIQDILYNNLEPETINLLYNLSDLYLVTSKSEAGPKAVIEACLTKTPILSTDVGLARDFLHNNCVFDGDDIGDVVKRILLKEYRYYVESNYKTALKTMDEAEIVKKYYTVLLDSVDE